MDQRFFEAMQSNPIVAAVKDDKGLRHCLSKEEMQVIFVLYGDVCSIVEIVRQIHEAGKIAIVHVDLVAGLAQKEIAVDYICQTAYADGIISTRRNLIQRAKELKMFTVLRMFVIDSMALSEAASLNGIQPDFLEILPGLMPGIIRKIRQATGLPILAGGLITTKQETIDALEAGAVAISTTNEAVWDM